MSFSFSPGLVIDATLYVLLVFSIITWTLIVYKSWDSFRNQRLNRQFDTQFWATTANAEAKALTLGAAHCSMANIAYAGFRCLEDLHRTGAKTIRYQSVSPAKSLTQALRVQIQQEMHRVDGGLTLLASIGSTAPFVGLFGTVLGIMRALQDISKSGSASLDVVAGPIGDALIATAIGIAVAVPAVLAYNFFQRRSKVQRIAMDNFADGFLHIAFTPDQPAQR